MGRGPSADRAGIADRWAVAALGLALVLPWAVIFTAIPPGEQQFPLNDDWAFAKGMFEFSAGRGIHYQGWASMPLLGQWLWAYLFVWALGPSFVTLRISTIILSWVGLAAFYDIVRRSGAPARVAAFATAALALFPEFFWLSGTFMTDVPALAFSLVALAFCGRALETGRAGPFLAGTTAAVLAVLTRQNTIAVPLTIVILLALQPEVRRRVLSWTLAIVPLVAAVSVHIWLQGRDDIVHREPELPGLLDAALLPFVALHFVGLAALPVLALGGWRGRPVVFEVVLALMAAGAAAVYSVLPDYLDPRRGMLFPYPDLWLPETNQLHGFRALVLEHTGLRWVLTVLGCVGGAMLVARLGAGSVRELLRQPLVIFTAVQFVLLLASPTLYGRYLIVLVPGGIFFAVWQRVWPPLTPGLSPPSGGRGEESDRINSRALPRRGDERGTPRAAKRPGVVGAWRWAVALVLLIASGAFGVGVYHDWLAWNSARWAIGRRTVEERHIPAERIEGGLEWDGWYSADPARWEQAVRRGRYAEPRGLMLPFNQACFPQLTGDYALSFAPIPGTQVVDSQPYSLWLSRGEHTFLLVRWTPGYVEYRHRLFGR